MEDHFTRTLGRPELLGRLGENSARTRQLLLTFDEASVLSAVERRMGEGQNMEKDGRQIRPELDGLVRRPHAVAAGELTAAGKPHPCHGSRGGGRGGLFHR